jgi:hypothetical protein
MHEIHAVPIAAAGSLRQATVDMVGGGNAQTAAVLGKTDFVTLV